MNAQRKKWSVFSAPVLLFLAITAIITIFPFLYMVTSTFKTKAEYTGNMMGLPKSVQWLNYRLIFESFSVLRLNLNSIKITGLSVVFGIIVTSMLGFALAKIRFPGKKILFTLIGFCMIMPPQVTFIPIYTLFSRIGLVNSHTSVILQYVSSVIPFTTLLITANCASINDGILESAKIDGAGLVIVFWRVIVPLLRPTLAVVAILNFLSHWNELFYAMILLQKEQIRTMTVALTSLVGRYTTNLPLMYTGLFINCIPVIIIFFVFQKQLIRGVSDGAIK